jgi:hypothetical protein
MLFDASEMDSPVGCDERLDDVNVRTLREPRLKYRISLVSTSKITKFDLLSTLQIVGYLRVADEKGPSIVTSSSSSLLLPTNVEIIFVEV